MVLCLTVRTAAQEAAHGTVIIPLHSVPAVRDPVFCRNTQMSLQSWGESVVDQRLSTENCWTDNHLVFKVNNMKEMIVDFRRTKVEKQ